MKKIIILLLLFLISCSSNSINITQTSLPLSFWINGGYWDLSTLSGQEGDSITVAIPSLIGTNVLTPFNDPIIWDHAVKGKRGVQVTDIATSNTKQMFRCDNISQLISSGNDFTILADFRADKLAYEPIFEALRSDGVSNERFGGRFEAEQIGIRKYSGTTTDNFYAGPLLSYAGSGTMDPGYGPGFGGPYDDHRTIWTYNKNTNTLIQNTDGHIDFSGPIDSTKITVDRFSILASFSSIAYEGFSGYLGTFAVSDNFATPEQIAQLQLDYIHQSKIKPFVESDQIFTSGDSITNGLKDELDATGWRGVLADDVLNNNLSLFFVGVNPYGIKQNRLTSSYSGATIEIISNQIASGIGYNDWTRVKLVFNMMGDGDLNEGQDGDMVLKTWSTAIETNFQRASVYQPSVRFVVSTIIPILGIPENNNIIKFNAGLSAAEDIFDKAHPNNKLFRADNNKALGGPDFQVQYYADKSAHPNHAGNILMGEAWLAASDGVQTVKEYMNQIGN